MNVGIDASRIAISERSGTENYTYNLIEALKRVDSVNKYTLYFNKLPQYFEITQPNVSTKYLPLPRFWTQGRLAWECLVNPPDVLFVPAHTLPIIHRPGLKTVVTIHDLGSEFLAEYHKFPQKLYLNWSTRYAVAFATQIIAVSKSTKKDLTERLRAKTEKVSVVYEAVDQEFFNPRSEVEQANVLSKYGLKGDFLLFVGTVQPRKNLERLIEAFSKLKNRKIQLVIAGKPGWLYGDIYSAPVKFGVAEQVKFIGYVPNEELPGLYSSATALIFPSLYEGFGLPVLEAMACDCPVVVSKSSSLPEIVAEAGLYFDPNRVETIVDSLKLILSKNALRSEMIDEGRKQVKKFTWEKTAKETLKVLQKAYENK